MTKIRYPALPLRLMMEPTPHDASPALEGSLVAGKYRVLRLVGSGGMGTVWEGVHEALGTRVAVKFIKPSHAQAADARKRFEIEARAAAKLHTKHAVHVFDYGVNDVGLPYIVMEFLEGESLSDTLIRRGPLPAHEVAKIIGEASKALTKAHTSGIVHRDLKPDNIFLATSSDDAADSYTVKLVDFGIAKMFDVPVEGETKAAPMGGPTQEGAVIGTPNFMAPEQLTVGGAPTPLTDLWSLGACAFAAMTARIPFEGEVLGDIVLKVCAAPLPVPSKINPKIPAGFDAWFARACHRDPTKRFQTAEELAEALANVCGTGRVRVATMSEDQVQYQLKQPSTADLAALAEEIEVPRSMSPRTALLAGLVLGVTMMVGILGAIAFRDKQQEDKLNVPTATPSVSVSSAPSVSVAPSASAAPSASTAAAARPTTHVRPTVATPMMTGSATASANANASASAAPATSAATTNADY